MSGCVTGYESHSGRIVLGYVVLYPGPVPISLTFGVNVFVQHRRENSVANNARRHSDL